MALSGFHPASGTPPCPTPDTSNSCLNLFTTTDTIRGRALRLAALDQLLGVAVAAQVMVKQKVFQRLAEGSIVGDALVELEVGVDDFLDHLLDLLVEGQAHILPRIGPRRSIERRVVAQPVHHLAERRLLLGAEVEPESLVQSG